MPRRRACVLLFLILPLNRKSRLKHWRLFYCDRSSHILRFHSDTPAAVQQVRLDAFVTE